MISIAFVLAIVTAAVPKDVLFKIFSGVATGLSDAQLEPVHRATCTWRCGCSRRPRCVGAAVSPAAPGARPRARPRPHDAASRRCASARSPSARHDAAHRPLLRGDRAAARLARTRGRGEHRTYADADVERLREILRLKELLGLSLDELRGLVEAEEARAGDPRAATAARPTPPSASGCCTRPRGHLDRQLELVRDRRTALDELEAELAERRERVTERLAELRPSPARRG